MIDEKTIDLLEEQKGQKYTFENIDKIELVNTLIDNIGNPDPHIRDDLIYPNLAHLLHDNHFGEEKLTIFLDILEDESHLFYDLDNKIENSVLTRSFSILQIVILLYVHKRDKVISKERIMELFKHFLEYFDREVNYEGYNKEVGFLHSIAHSADLFQQFMSIEYFGKEELEKMFNAISKKFKTKTYFFQHDEDERMVKAVVEGLNRNILSDEFLFDWIDDFARYKKVVEYPDMYYITNNIKILLRSLYFALMDEKKYTSLTDRIVMTLKEKIKLR